MRDAGCHTGATPPSQNGKHVRQTFIRNSMAISNCPASYSREKHNRNTKTHGQWSLRGLIHGIEEGVGTPSPVGNDGRYGVTKNLRFPMKLASCSRELIGLIRCRQRWFVATCRILLSSHDLPRCANPPENPHRLRFAFTKSMARQNPRRYPPRRSAHIFLWVLSTDTLASCLPSRR